MKKKTPPLKWTDDVFLSSAEAAKYMGTKCAKIIKNQSGYRRGEPMIIQKTKNTEGFRLYVAVAGNWMDASLQDLPTN